MYNQKLLKGSVVIAKVLPPYPSSKIARRIEAKAQLAIAIQYLESQSWCDITMLLLLKAIVDSLQYSEESHERFMKIGYLAAIELYEIANIQRNLQETQTDPDNPRNWLSYCQEHEV